MNDIKEQLESHISLMNTIQDDDSFLSIVNEAMNAIIDCYRANKKVVLFGCGGSAADSQHIAAEFVNRFYFNRPCLPAVALTTDTSIITAIANDFDFNDVYSRQVEGIVAENDVVIGISTSGMSDCVLNGLSAAKAKNAITIGFTGGSGGKMASVCDILINVPSSSTPRIQEAHITIAHIICAGVESEIFNERV
jgi:D-sedoheptulose 7-phosphate isomerase